MESGYSSIGTHTPETLQQASDKEAVAGFITDAEGNWEYFKHCVDISSVISFGGDGSLEFSRDSSHEDVFVFGGDTCDKGDGDIRITQVLVAFKERYPERVHLLAGNRDLNKIRLTSELSETEIDVPYPLPVYPGASEPQSLRDYLTKLDVGGEGDLDLLNTRANRLRWLLDITLGAQGMFEKRRAELSLLSGKNASEDDVVDSYLQSVAQDDGFLWRYLQLAEMAYLWGSTLFVHGGLPEGAPGWLPPLSLPYVQPSKGATCPGEQLPAEHSIQDWIASMNARLKQGLADYRSAMYWQEGRCRGGEMLMSWQSTPACYGHSIVVESALRMGTPSPMPESVSQYLLERGVSRVVSGHKPCGDSPFVLRGLPELVCCDTTYSDGKASDKRGAAAAAVELVGTPARSFARVRGTLCDGSSFEFKLSPPGESLGEGVGAECDPYVGRCTVDGWWVKAPLAEGCYHCAQSLPGSRTVSYKVLKETELEF